MFKTLKEVIDLFTLKKNVIYTRFLTLILDTISSLIVELLLVESLIFSNASRIILNRV